MTAQSARKNLPDAIIAELQQRILRGEVKPGERLPPERELALSLGTNRNTLREALRALESQGLVRARQGDGVRVLDFRQTGELGLLPAFLKAAQTDERGRALGDLLRIRALAALEAVVLAARRAGPEEIARLQALGRQLFAAQARGDVPALAEAELALYRAVTEAAESISALWLFNSLEKVIRGLLDATPDIWVTPECYQEAWEGVLEGVAAHDPQAARASMARLLKDTDAIILTFLGLEDEDAPAGD